jgi:hypothetical protein
MAIASPPNGTPEGLERQGPDTRLVRGLPQAEAGLRIKGAVRFIAASLRSGANNRKILSTLQAEARAVSDAAELLSLHAQGVAGRDTAQRLLALKLRIHQMKGTLVSGLRDSRISPLTHEDIYTLSASLGKVFEGIENVASLPQRFFRPPAPVVRTSITCAQSVLSAMLQLPGGSELLPHVLELAELARKTDLQLRDAELAKLAAERNAIRYLEHRQRLLALRVLFQRYRNMARALEYALIKNN